MATARILKLKELTPGKIVWLQRSHIVEPHIVEITSVRKGENYFGQKCMEVDFSEPWSRCFTFYHRAKITMTIRMLGYAGMQNQLNNK